MPIVVQLVPVLPQHCVRPQLQGQRRHLLLLPPPLGPLRQQHNEDDEADEEDATKDGADDDGNARRGGLVLDEAHVHVEVAVLDLEKRGGSFF